MPGIFDMLEEWRQRYFGDTQNAAEEAVVEEPIETSKQIVALLRRGNKSVSLQYRESEPDTVIPLQHGLSVRLGQNLDHEARDLAVPASLHTKLNIILGVLSSVAKRYEEFRSRADYENFALSLSDELATADAQVAQHKARMAQVSEEIEAGVELKLAIANDRSAPQLDGVVAVPITSQSPESVDEMAERETLLDDSQKLRVKAAVADLVEPTYWRERTQYADLYAASTDLYVLTKAAIAFENDFQNGDLDGLGDSVETEYYRSDFNQVLAEIKPGVADRLKPVEEDEQAKSSAPLPSPM